MVAGSDPLPLCVIAIDVSSNRHERVALLDDVMLHLSSATLAALVTISLPLLAQPIVVRLHVLDQVQRQSLPLQNSSVTIKPFAPINRFHNPLIAVEMNRKCLAVDSQGWRLTTSRVHTRQPDEQLDILVHVDRLILCPVPSPLALAPLALPLLLDLVEPLRRSLHPFPSRCMKILNP